MLRIRKFIEKIRKLLKQIKQWILSKKPRKQIIFSAATLFNKFSPRTREFLLLLYNYIENNEIEKLVQRWRYLVPEVEKLKWRILKLSFEDRLRIYEFLGKLIEERKLNFLESLVEIDEYFEIYERFRKLPLPSKGTVAGILQFGNVEKKRLKVLRRIILLAEEIAGTSRERKVIKKIGRGYYPAYFGKLTDLDELIRLDVLSRLLLSLDAGRVLLLSEEARCLKTYSLESTWMKKRKTEIDKIGILIDVSGSMVMLCPVENLTFLDLACAIALAVIKKYRPKQVKIGFFDVVLHVADVKTVEDVIDVLLRILDSYGGTSIGRAVVQFYEKFGRELDQIYVITDGCDSDIPPKFSNVKIVLLNRYCFEHYWRTSRMRDDVVLPRYENGKVYVQI